MDLRNFELLSAYERQLQHRTVLHQIRPHHIDLPEPLHAMTRVERLTMETVRLAHRIACNDKISHAFRRTPAHVLDTRSGVKVIYEAPEPGAVPFLMAELMRNLFPITPLPYDVAMFHAAQLHAMFLCIHPYTDGNGRTARFLEKWCLSRHVGQWAWQLDTEAYYEANREAYVNNLNAIGSTWESLDWSKTLPFLLMLPAAIEHQLNR